MTIKVRRVVTGHDGKGRAVVKIDEVSKNIVSNRPGGLGVRDRRPTPSRPTTRAIPTARPGKSAPRFPAARCSASSNSRPACAARATAPTRSTTRW